jgi:hypothetical protein
MAGAVGQGNVIGLLRLLASSMVSGDTVRRNGKPPCACRVPPLRRQEYDRDQCANHSGALGEGYRFMQQQWSQ